jgi:DNA-binding transcriptional MerR regulator
VPSSLAIGDFSRATHLSIKTLRHYHQVGLLEPAEIDSDTGYRRYSTEQIPVAQVIRRFRDLDMPLGLIGAVLSASDLGSRNELIAAHLAKLESDLAQTQSAVASLRDLLQGGAKDAEITHRRISSARAAAICETVDTVDAMSWLRGALAELTATARVQGLAVIGEAGGIYSNELFFIGRGEATVFIPTNAIVRPMGRVTQLEVPAVELATVVHSGPHAGVDRAYGALAAYVTEHALGVEGPIREYYLVGPQDSDDEETWRTQIGWPIFETGSPTRFN